MGQNINIDFAKNKFAIISVVIILAALIIAYKIYQANTLELEQLYQTKDSDLRKNDLLGKIGAYDKKIKNYKAFLNRASKADKSTIMTNIGNIAKESLVKIVSVRPLQEVESAIFTQYNFNLTIRVDNYEAAGQFISRLEDSDDVFMVDVLSIRPNMEAGPGYRQEKMTGLTINLKLCTYVYKD